MSVTAKISKKPDSSKNFKLGVVVSAIVLVLILGALGIIAVLNMNKSDTPKATSTATTITTTVTTTSSSVTTSPIINATTSAVINQTSTPVVSSTPAVSKTPEVTESLTFTTIPTSTSTNPQSSSNKEYDINFTLPGNWTVSSSPTSGDCKLTQQYLKSPCTGNVATETLHINSADMNTKNQNYGITIIGGTSGIGDPSCADSNSTPTSFYAFIKGTRYDFPTCVSSSGEEFTGRVSLQIPGSSSKWNTVFLSFDAKDRPMVDQILDILVSIH